jgi:hypothetical protein
MKWSEVIIDMNGRITITVLCSIIVAIGIFYVGITWYQDTFNPTIIWTKSISEKIDFDQKKVFIIGNSHVGSIDPYYVEKKINKNGYDFRIFNLSVGGDNPQKRENIIKQIIDLKPNLVIYGIDYRSFEVSSSEHEIQAVSSTKINKIEKIIPSFQDFFYEFLSPVTNSEWFSNIPQSPKIITLRIFNHLIYGSVELERLNLDSQKPLITNEAVGIKPMNNTELQQWIDERRSFRGIPQLDENHQFNSLQRILDKLKENEIKFVLFTSPHHETYLGYLSNEDKIIFDEMLLNIEINYNTKIIQLHDKYRNMEIFANPTHVAIETSQEYSNDLIEIIINELKN